MLNFAPTEEQEEIRHLAQSIAMEQLRPQGRSSEKNGDISSTVMQMLAQTGLTTPFPEIYGGSGRVEALTYALIAEELGFGDGGLAMNVLGSMMGPLAVALAGSESQQELYLPAFSDEKTGYTQRGSFAFAERVGGYSVADVSATLHPDGENYILNGTKRDVIHGAQSLPRVVVCRVEGSSGLEGLCAVVLAPTDGLHIQHDVQKLGLIAAPSASYAFDNVVLHPGSLLGAVGNTGVACAVSLANMLRAGVACGMARASLEYASAYARDRIAFGRPIASYQSIAFIIAEMAMKLDAARLLLWNAAVQWDASADSETLIRTSEAAQYQAVKIAKSATLDAVQVLGGAGYIQDHPVEMWARNAAAME